jgi:hypothetical protein
MPTVEVEAQIDHLDGLTKVAPVTALSELIWNSLDADASRVEISVEENALKGIDRITVSDNGHGLPHSEAEACFGKLGGSWKRHAQHTQKHKRMLHGREGKGRFRAFSLGSKVQWRFQYKQNGSTLAYTVAGWRSNLKNFTVDDTPVPGTTTEPGTSVIIEQTSENLGVLGTDGKADQVLCETFALYLRHYPYVRIMFNGRELNPSEAQKDSKTYPLPAIEVVPGKKITSELDIIEWNSKHDRKLCLCGQAGYTVHEIDPKIRPGSEFNFTGYIRSPYIDELQANNRLLLEDLDVGLQAIITAARDQLRAHFREKKAKAAEQLVNEWKAEGIYPYSEDSADPIDVARRQVFDICALNVYEHLDDFRQSDAKGRKFTLRMLKQALDENPASLQRILKEVLDLPEDKRNELSELLEKTTLSAIIEASRLVTDRLDFLKGLEELLFHPDSKRELEERSQLHRILEKNTWIFGEEFNLTNSDESLTTVLKGHLGKLRPGVRIDQVVRDDGRRAIIDLLLGQDVPQGHKVKKEYLVVELKRPSEIIDLTVKGQIESYALAVARDERFDKANTHWTFIAVSNDISDDALETVTQEHLPRGFFHMKGNIRIGLARWGDILNTCRTRLQLFREKLGYEATASSGLDLLRERYDDFLPDSMKAKKAPDNNCPPESIASQPAESKA